MLARCACDFISCAGAVTAVRAVFVLVARFLVAAWSSGSRAYMPVKVLSTTAVAAQVGGKEQPSANKQTESKGIKGSPAPGAAKAPAGQAWLDSLNNSPVGSEGIKAASPIAQ